MILLRELRLDVGTGGWFTTSEVVVVTTDNDDDTFLVAVEDVDIVVDVVVDTLTFGLYEITIRELFPLLLLLLWLFCASQTLLLFLH